MLEQRGAVVFDADLLARKAVETGTPGYQAVVERFGADVLAPGGDLDREALASIVFADPAARRDLEAIVHPEVRRMFAEGTEEHRDSNRVVVFSAPLLVETGMHTAFEVLLVVSTTKVRSKSSRHRSSAPGPTSSSASGADVGYAAVFFDAGETLVHPHSTFPDLFAQILRREGHDVTPELVRERGHVVFDRFRVAAENQELWTTSPERSRRFWHEVYEIFLSELGVPNANGLIDTVYGEFTDRSNYRLFEDVPAVLDRLRRAGLILGVVSNFEAWLERLLDELGGTDSFAVP